MLHLENCNDIWCKNRPPKEQRYDGKILCSIACAMQLRHDKAEEQDLLLLLLVTLLGIFFREQRNEILHRKKHSRSVVGVSQNDTVRKVQGHYIRSEITKYRANLFLRKVALVAE